MSIEKKPPYIDTSTPASSAKQNTKGLQIVLITLFAGLLIGGFLFWIIFGGAPTPTEEVKIEPDSLFVAQQIIPQSTRQKTDTLPKYNYIAHLEFSVDAANTNRTYLDPRSTKMQIAIPISKDYYEATNDSMVLKSNTIVSNKFANLLNISTITLVKREKIEL